MSKKYYLIFFLASIFLLGTESIVGSHPPFGFDYFGFFLWFSFVSGVALIWVSFLLGKLIKRKNDYYDD